MHLTAFFSGMLPQAGWNPHNWKEKHCNVNMSQATALYGVVRAIYSSQLAVSNSRIYKLHAVTNNRGSNKDRANRKL